MIEVNATIFVQIINFFIAYLLFRFLLFKPAHHIILQQESDLKDLNDRIQDTQKRVHDKQMYQYTQWQQCHDYYITNVPQVPAKVELLRGVIPSLRYEIPENARLEQLITKESDRLVTLLGSKHGRA